MTTLIEHTYAVILCGGGGSRLWPKSRIKTPKQLLKLTGGETMVQVAASRLNRLVSWDNIIIVTNKLYNEQIQQLLPKVPKENFISEPVKKDTAMAMLVGAIFAKNKDPDAVIINGASDHVVEDQDEFVKVMKAAVIVAAKQKDLITVGITPTRPDTAFGYIKAGEHLHNTSLGCPVFRVADFTEKPNEATARAFLSTGKYFWNANMYVWSAQALISAFEDQSPDVLAAAQPLIGVKPDVFQKLLTAAYQVAPSISIDYAISEKATNLLLIPGDFGWNDIGDWKVVYDLGQKDDHGNVIITDAQDSNVVVLNSYNNLVHSNTRLIGLIGVSDLAVIDTGEILLIVPKEKSQDVKKMVDKLKLDNKKEYL